MSHRVVYDTMIFFQWAVLPEDRQHRTVKSLYDGSVRLCLSPDLLAEIRDVLTRQELQDRFPTLTLERVDHVLNEAVKHADWIQNVPSAFTWPRHPDDDHVFNLAIEARSRFLVTWETRILNLAKELSPDADRFRALAPTLTIISPAQLAQILKFDRDTPTVDSATSEL